MRCSYDECVRVRACVLCFMSTCSLSPNVLVISGWSARTVATRCVPRHRPWRKHLSPSNSSHRSSCGVILSSCFSPNKVAPVRRSSLSPRAKKGHPPASNEHFLFCLPSGMNLLRFLLFHEVGQNSGWQSRWRWWLKIMGSIFISSSSSFVVQVGSHSISA